MSNHQTIVDAKAAFIRAQVRHLSAPLQPSSSWQGQTEHDDLNPKTVESVIAKVNDKIKKHAGLVYSAQSQRHVAEQIDTLYWTVVTQESAQADRGAVAVKKAAELTTREAVKAMPESGEELHLDGDREVGEEEKQRYEDLRAQLQSLIAKRDGQQARLAHYRQLQELLRPFENAQETIQPNLVTRDGELAKELEKMRMLLARVTGRISELNTPEHRRLDGQETGCDNAQKLAKIMDMT